ncbi:MAG: amidohydrolase family protein [Microscillaceae bacterium]|jgi:imidazolonepropionase-like amidohydrolase|nr:amidohydrolase family protein [Microscillaceae bacterium]
MKNIFYIMIFFGASVMAVRAQIPAKDQTQPIVLSNATIHVGNGQVLNNASIRIEKGNIVAVGENVDKSGAEEINLAGKHIYPGLILLSSALGLNEVEAVRPSQDYSETGDFNPHVRSLIAYNTDSEVIPTLRSNGVLLAQVAPRGGLVSGTSSVMELDGWNWEDAVNTTDDGIHINWVPMFTRGGFFSENPGKIEKNAKRNEVLQIAETIFQECKAYLDNPTPKQKNLKFEAMRGLFEGSKALYIHVDFSKEIVEAVQFAQKHQVKRIVIIGGEGALAVAEFLKENQVPVVLGRLHRTPSRNEEGVWLPYQLPNLLQKAGVKVCLGHEVDGGSSRDARNLPFMAGTAVAYGVGKEEALQMITATPAKILGIDNKVGTLEVGKQATLVVSQGDLLDMRTSQVTHAFIRGKKIDLDDKHKQLYQKFKNKYEGK